MSNVTEFPRQTAPDLLCGPFEYYHVVVDSRAVPRLSGRRHEDGSVSLTVDNRFGATFEKEADASQAAWLIAQASAIASGYPHFAAETKDAPFAPIMRGITVVPESAEVSTIKPGPASDPQP
jgi:hypothetical protein